MWCGGCCRLLRCFWLLSASARSSCGPQVGLGEALSIPTAPGRSCARAEIRIPETTGRQGMMYSPWLMDVGREANNIERLEERLAELEKLTEKLEDASGSGVVDVLDRAVALLKDVNAHIEAGLLKSEGEAQELDDLLKKADFGPFDAALEELKRPLGGPGGG